MQPGDVLLVGTDGIWEAANPQGERFGKDRLRKLLKEHHECSSSQITQKIVQAVHEFLAGGRHTDDITLIVVKAV
jgi:sigma-B regulation protein RsbU (phosphoserine phosphatase)